MQINVLEAKNQLSRLLVAAERGEKVIIARHGKPVVRLMPLQSGKGLSGFGRLKSKMPLSDDAFSQDTEAEVAQLFGMDKHG